MHVAGAESDPLRFDVCSALSGAARFFWTDASILLIYRVIKKIKMTKAEPVGDLQTVVHCPCSLHGGGFSMNFPSEVREVCGSTLHADHCQASPWWLDVRRWRLQGTALWESSGFPCIIGGNPSRAFSKQCPWETCRAFPRETRQQQNRCWVSCFCTYQGLVFCKCGTLSFLLPQQSSWVNAGWPGRLPYR